MCVHVQSKEQRNFITGFVITNDTWPWAGCGESDGSKLISPSVRNGLLFPLMFV